MADYTLIMNAFQPGKEIENPSHFAGRVAQVKQITNALHARGECPVIYGDRGLGKTSLALQSARIAMGDVELLHHLGMKELSFTPDDSFLTFYVNCAYGTRDTESILQRLINAAENVAPASDCQGHATQLVDRTTSKKVSFKVFELSTVNRYQERTGRRHTSLALDERFIETVNILTDTYRHPALFIVDELDKVNDITGFGSFIKACSGIESKFLLVGVGENVSDLLGDHASVARIIAPTRIPPMKPAELLLIIKNACTELGAAGLQAVFSRRVSDRLIEMAGGFPWFIHLLGKYALLAAFSGRKDNDKTIVVEARHLVQAVLDCADDRLAHQYSELYTNIVGRARWREIVLRGLAMWPEVQIRTRDIYRFLQELGVNDPAQHVRYLESKAAERVLLPCRGKKGYVRFSNPIFKLYVQNFCEPTHKEVREILWSANALMDAIIGSAE
jgi:hypothetical protein